MDKTSHWSAESCRWVPAVGQADLYWSVQRCLWEPLGPAADALATPWAVFAAAQAEAQVPRQREPEPGLVEA